MKDLKINIAIISHMRVRGFVTYYTYFDHGSNKNSKPFQFPKPEGRGDVYNTYESIELLKA